MQGKAHQRGHGIVGQEFSDPGIIDRTFFGLSFSLIRDLVSELSISDYSWPILYRSAAKVQTE